MDDLSRDVRFERVTGSDLDSFYELRRNSIRAGCAGHYDASLLELWTDPSSDGPFPGPLPELFYLARIEAVTVAAGMLDLTTGRIDAMFVAPAYVGRGIGGAMMKHLFGIAIAHGVHELSLQATLNAVEFYRSQGFGGDEISTYRSPRGVTLPCVPMRIHLG